MRYLKNKKIVCALLAMCMSTLILGTSAHATSYQTYIARGVKNLCWSKCTIDWNANGTEITSYDTDQQKSGVLVNLEGVKKLSKSTSSKYYFQSKTELLVGAEINGVTIGWATTVVDECLVKATGSSSWTPGI